MKESNEGGGEPLEVNKTERAVLRGIELSDAQFFSAWARDPETRALQGARRTPLTLRDAKRLVGSLIAENGRSHLAFMIDVGGVTVGNCWLGNLDVENRSASLGIVIGNPSYRDRGLGQSVVRNLVAIGLHELGLERIELWTLASNKRAIRAYEKAGFRKEGTRRGHILWDGVRQDTVLMGLLR